VNLTSPKDRVTRFFELLGHGAEAAHIENTHRILRKSAPPIGYLGQNPRVGNLRFGVFDPKIHTTPFLSDSERQGEAIARFRYESEFVHFSIFPLTN